MSENRHSFPYALVGEFRMKAKVHRERAEDLSLPERIKLEHTSQALAYDRCAEDLISLYPGGNAPESSEEGFKYPSVETGHLISPPNGAGPYAFGSDVWPGMAKLIEEMGELHQVLGKLMALGGTEVNHWDGTNMVSRLEEEIGDVQAALSFFASKNGVDLKRVSARSSMKLKLFEEWDS